MGFQERVGEETYGGPSKSSTRVSRLRTTFAADQIMGEAMIRDSTGRPYVLWLAATGQRVDTHSAVTNPCRPAMI